MAKYRKKPVVVEAEQWFQGKCIKGVIGWTENYGRIQTLEGWHIVSPGDWIIIGVMGEKYPCKDIIFQATYDPVIEL